MTSLDRILEVLPPPYTVAQTSTLAQLLGVIALEAETYQEDLEVLRRTHWVDFADRLVDLVKLGALVGVSALSWETPAMFRSRLHAMFAHLIPSPSAVDLKFLQLGRKLA